MIIHLYMVESAWLWRFCFLKELFKSIVLMKRYITLTGGSENVNFLKYSPIFMLFSVRI